MILTYDNKQVKCIIKDPNEHQQKHWVHGNFYETHRGGLLNWVYKQGFKNIIDVGASIGNHSLFFAGIMEANVLAIEPYKPSYDHLEENIKLNKLNISTIQAALGLKEGRITMVPVSDSNIGMVQGKPGNDVTVTTFDQLNIHGLLLHVDYIKIDVEHSNVGVLKGATVLKDINPVISIECESKQMLKATNQIMQSYGYKIIPNLKLNHTPTYVWIK